jgi:hypothetical protein
MMHWARVISEDDNGEWVGVVHSDGTYSRVKIGVFADEIHVDLKPAAGKRVIFHDGTAQR